MTTYDRERRDEPPELPSWLHQLAEALREQRSPGVRVQRRDPGRPGAPRSSAVLILFGARANDGAPDVLLIERAHTLRNHAGQPAFPGGASDPEDDGPVATALREAWEETGLEPAGVTIFGQLPELYLPPTDFLVTPVLGWWRVPSAVRPVDPREVAAVRRVPIADLVEPANRLVVRHPSGWQGPAFRVHEMLVWGFTAGLLDALLRLGGWERPWNTEHVEELPPDVLSRAMREANRAGGTPLPAPERDYSDYSEVQAELPDGPGFSPQLDDGPS